jgi:hypothetical protein
LPAYFSERSGGSLNSARMGALGFSGGLLQKAAALSGAETGLGGVGGGGISWLLADELGDGGS